MSALQWGAVDPNWREHIKTPLHLEGAKIGHVLQADVNAEDVFAETGRVVIRRSRYEGSSQYPPSLVMANGPAVVGSFRWSGLYVDGDYDVDLTDLFTKAVVLGDHLPYRGWRARAIIETGYATALYGPSPTTPNPQRAAQGFFGVNFERVDGGWALASPSGGIQYGAHTAYRYIFNNGGVGIYYRINYQIELGYGNPDFHGGAPGTDQRDDYRYEDGWIGWPTYGAGVATDHDDWRGFPQFYPNHP